MPLPEWASHYATLSDRELQAAYADLANAVDDAGIEAGESDYAKLQAMEAELATRERAACYATRQRGDDDGLSGYSDPRDERDERRGF